VYPEGFVAEVQRTLQLLFPTVVPGQTTSTRRYVRRYNGDLEARIMGSNKEIFDLNTYPFFGERLENIQKRYNNSRYRRKRQWWFDRRSRIEWATLVVAIVVFILTVIFGLISSVTGILQVYAAYKWHNN
jgi:hypothetical protein